MFREDAYTLFAPLNNRGVPLSAVGLIKNALLAKLADAGEDGLDYHFEQWQEVLRNLGDECTVQERSPPDYDAFRRDAAFRERLEGPVYDVNPDMTRYILTTLTEPSVTKERGASGSATRPTTTYGRSNTYSRKGRTSRQAGSR